MWRGTYKKKLDQVNANWKRKTKIQSHFFIKRHNVFGKICINHKILEFTFQKLIVAVVIFLCTDEIKCGWFTKDFLPWTTTLLSSVLSLFLTVIYVIKCSSWANLKGILLCFLYYLSWNTNLFVFLFQPKKVNFF